MPRGLEGNEMATPKAPAKQAPASSNKKNQPSILGFFQKKPGPPSTPSSVQSGSASKQTSRSIESASHKRGAANLTPAPSSDAVAPSSPALPSPAGDKDNDKENGLPSPQTQSDDVADGIDRDVEAIKLSSSSPSRKVKKRVNYAESEDEDEEIFKPLSNNAANSRLSKRRRISIEESEDEYGDDAAVVDAADDDDDIDDFIVPDDSEDEPVSSKRRNRASKSSTARPPPSSPPTLPTEDTLDLELPAVSTAQQWNFDPENPARINPAAPQTANKSSEKKRKEKAHQTEPEKRHAWLETVLDADRNPVGHPDYDPRTIFVPPLAWTKFSPFEKQYWEIKQKFWDTIVFFKKGKFYELYENDATIGHQLFDLKLTDRVNMRMVGVPEASLNQWATQFVAKGYKIARVDQLESALAKEMRERGGVKPSKVAKEDKVIRRELASVLTGGTLVDGGMLQDDMSTFCAAIKETQLEGRPHFGIAFVDTATAQFHLCELLDDVEMTKFETFVAQVRPGELLLEKGGITSKALRILKTNTGPTTIWNYLKPQKEFWPGDITTREVEVSGYFASDDENAGDPWPKALREATEKDVVMSAFGALLQYLRTLKIERDLVTLGNISWYDPIKKTTTLVLDGQSLINLEIFTNSHDGTSNGTLFSMVNRCITPFGKRMLRQWVCHPLVDIDRINARLDAVDGLNADGTIMDRFTSCLSKLPDLERLISRIHAGTCNATDFVKVLEGFEQIEYTMSLLSSFGDGEGIIGQLITAMPDLAPTLKYWKTAFDRDQAKKTGVLVPEPGVETDFDQSQADIDDVMKEFDALLKKVRRDLGSSSVCFRDNGKEIYQLEVPIKVKGVPKHWDQMSATAKVKRYYSPELRKLVRKLQELQETHGQIVKEVAGRFSARFDKDYPSWLAAIKVIAHLDCLISLARASASLGEPRCRPLFVEEEKTVLEFNELRHPCMETTVADFIPNDVKLGGSAENIDLLTGANAAGKSTILRMTCVAVIMAQIGCYLPCTSATITPIDRIMSRLGANDNIFAAQSTFFVELSETKKILSEATPRSLVILDELGRGTSSYDGVAVAQAVLHHVATHIGCIGFFATHYHSLATEFADHPNVSCKRMQIRVDDENRQVTFLYKLEGGIAEGSFGMHCAAMCGIPTKVIERAEIAAKEWEHTSKLKESFEKAKSGCYVPLGMQSDLAWMLKRDVEEVDERGLEVLRKAIASL